jgi:hypothetical protein
MVDDQIDDDANAAHARLALELDEVAQRAQARVGHILQVRLAAVPPQDDAPLPLRG